MLTTCNQKEQVEEDGDLSFEELGLDPRLVRALSKKSIIKATPIQSEAIPLILEGKDVVARAKTGSGKTFAYLLPLLQKLFFESGGPKKSGPSAFILLPTRELCRQVYSEASSLLELCRVQLKVVQLMSDMSVTDMTVALSGPPELVISTPACVSSCLSRGIMQASCITDSLSLLILDEADLLLSHGYEDDLKILVPHVPRRCQCLLMSATSSSDVEKLKKLVLHNPVTLTLADANYPRNEIIPKNVHQFLIYCSANDKLLYMLALLKLELVQKRVLIFVNYIDTGFRLKLFLEQFGIKSAVLNAELPHNSRSHILEEFNAGLFDFLIATDDNKEKGQNSKDGQTKSKGSKKYFRRKLDTEFGVVRGIDFKNVFTVINFDMPQTPEGYVHRVGRTGRAYNTGASISIVSSPEEDKIIENVKVTLSDGGDKDISNYIAPFPLLTTNAVESLRYRAEDVVKSVTRFAIRESRAQDLRNEILNSEKLQAHFEENPKDLDLLKHDKLLSKNAPSAHLREVPEYLIDPTTQEARKAVKLCRAALGIQNRKRRHTAFNKGFRKSKDPLKNFTSETQPQEQINGMYSSEDPISLETLLSALPGRKTQIFEILRLVGSLNSPMLPLLIYGGPSNGKTISILQIFRYLNRPFVYAGCRTCYSPRILFDSILSQLLLHGRNPGKGSSGTKRCEKPSEFIDLLRNALVQALCALRERKLKVGSDGSDRGEMIYVIFDNFELLHSWDKSSNLVSLLLQIHDILKIHEVGVIYISSSTPDAYYLSTGSFEPLTVYFPAYTLEDLHGIFMMNQPNPKLYSSFLSVVLKPFFRVTRRVDELSVAFQHLFQKYCEPLADQSFVPDEVMKRKLFDNLQPFLTVSLNDVFNKQDGDFHKKRTRKSIRKEASNELDFHMSMPVKYLLLSSFIASRNPATLDAALFDSSGVLSNRKRNKNSQMSMDRKDSMAAEIILKGPGSFPLERLLAIFQCITSVTESMVEDEQFENGAAIENESFGLTSDVLLQLSTLCNANFICKGGSCPLEGSTRYRCTIDEEMAIKVARSINFPLSSYLYRR